MTHRTPLPWITVAPNAPYFVTETGEAWTPVGHNDSITWPALRGLYGRRDLASVERYLAMLARRGVTVLRLMLEYAEADNRYLERPCGSFNPRMVRLWDDLVRLCEKYSLRLLLTPFDTFWMWIRWQRHPYNQANGGPCRDRACLLLCPATRAAMKERLRFATERWGASGAVFAWDLWNEIHPSHAQDSAAVFHEFIEDMATWMRAHETRVHGRAHPMTVSIFAPHIALDEARIRPAIFRHPALDFASTHLYQEGTIDYPENTIDAAVSIGRLVREAVGEIHDGRPYFDSEHGPIHSFKDHHITLPEPYDDEYFRHIQWAHLASGGAGGGMRWPNRDPHVLTRGMHAAQRGLARFLPLIDWSRFRRRNLNQEVDTGGAPVAVFACGDREQAVVWLLRRDTVRGDGRLDPRAGPLRVRLSVPGLEPGECRVTAWDTAAGRACGEFIAHPDRLETPPLVRDLALALSFTSRASRSPGAAS